MTNKQSPEGIEDKTKSTDLARRRFTKSGLAASGVILTLASRPVLADTVCKSPSGFLSGNVSSHIEQLCTGNYPSYYADNPDAWKGTQYDPGTINTKEAQSSDAESTTSATSNKNSNTTKDIDKWVGGTQYQQAFPGASRFPGRSMMQVLWIGDVMGESFVAALLNAALGLTPPLTEIKVINMCVEYETRGFFEPTAGVHWFEQDILFYLNSLA